MNKIGIAGLGLLVMLAQHPLESQRAAIQNSQIRQERDTEFLSLYQQVGNLEKKLADEPPETKDRVYMKSVVEDGKIVEFERNMGPPSISDRIMEKMYDKITILASRYGFSFDRNETSTFTSGKSLVVSNMANGLQYVIFSEFSAIDSRISGVDIFIKNRIYKYQVFESIPVKSGVEIISHPEITNGLIPLFDTFDFEGISRTIMRLSLDAEKSTRYKQSESDSVYLSADERYSYSSAQLTNIGIMLLRMIEDNPDMGDLKLPIPKRNMTIPTPRVSRNNRIILDGKAFVESPYFPYGNLTLSIEPNGSVNYFFQMAFASHPWPPVYKTLKINFQSFSK